MRGRVVVIGSINIDLVVSAERLPQPGETVLGGRFSAHQGGKGANQAVAAARAGADVALIAAVGEDAYGEAAVRALAAEGIDVSHVQRVSAPTGVALIAVGPRGENQIVLAPGANDLVGPESVDTELIAGAAVVVTNHEVPMPTVVAGVRAATDAGVTTIVNPAPAHALPAELLALGPILTPNEHELVVAIGNDDSAAALDELSRRTAGPIIVTQGPAGALLVHGSRRQRFEGYRAPAAVDTTGAGDAFGGVLATWLAEGQPLEEAIDAANAAGAMSVAVAGAREGMATRADLEAYIAEGRQ